MKKLNQFLSIILSALLIDLPLYASSNVVTDGTTNTTIDKILTLNLTQFVVI